MVGQRKLCVHQPPAAGARSPWSTTYNQIRAELLSLSQAGPIPKAQGFVSSSAKLMTSFDPIVVALSSMMPGQHSNRSCVLRSLCCGRMMTVHPCILLLTFAPEQCPYPLLCNLESPEAHFCRRLMRYLVHCTVARRPRRKHIAPEMLQPSATDGLPTAMKSNNSTS